jgi:AcrR family transcriptional regulator
VAARQQFAFHGWRGTTLKAIAHEAAVAEPTVYAVFGSKAGLAMALVDAVDETAGLDALLSVLADASATPHEQLRAAVEFEGRIASDAGDIVRLLRDGSDDDPELRAAYASGLERARAGFRRMAAGWPTGSLREGVSVDWAADVYAATATMDPYDTLVGFGWSAEQVTDWWYRSLSSTVLAPAAL